MSARRSRKATGEWRIVVPIAIFGALLAGCTTSSDNSFGLTNPSFNAAGAAVAAGEGAAPPVADGVVPEPAIASPTDGTPAAVAGVMDPTDQPLPAEVAYLPTANPAVASEYPPVPTMAEASANAEAAVAGIAAPASADGAAASAGGHEPARTTEATVASAETAEPEFFLTAAQPAAPAPVKKKRGFLSNLFSSAEAAPMKAAAPVRATAAAPAKPLVQLASVEPDDEKPVRAAAFAGEENALPGVRKTALFEIRRKSGLDDDSDVDLHEDEEEFNGSYQVASAAGLARLAPNGLLKQTDNVDVTCLKPSLVRTLKAVERHYGRKMVVTSGYRDQQRNRRARGAKNSLHMYCAAADVQVPGVSKWELAAFVRSMPGRGGVGTYCHTESVHIDVGPERDWNWRCRGKRKKRRA